MKPHHMLVLWSILCLVEIDCTIRDNVLGTGEAGRSPETGKRLSTGTGARNQVRRTRPPALSAPPYAVAMEPLFKYSQRDPLYDTNAPNNVTTHQTAKISSKADFDVEPTKNILKRLPFGTRGRRPHHPKPHHHPPPQHHHYPYYPEPPEPIIEIIIKESNISLPAPTTTPPPPTTKEPIHVFYVKYKKNPNPTDHGDEIIYEEPVPALTPHATEIVEEQPNYGPTYAEVVATPAPPPPSTTLRTIIRPDSEVYHGSGLKVTFGGPEKHGNHEEYGQSAPLPQVALPEEKSSIKSDEPKEANKHHYAKRQQGPYPQKELGQEAPVYQQQAEQLQYRGPVPLENPPVQINNHRFPGQAEQKYFNRQASRFSNVQQQNSSPLYQNNYRFQNGPQNAGPTFGAPTQATQHNDRSFVQPTQHLQHANPYPTQQFDPTGSPQLIPSLSTVTEQQIQEYQKHKEYLIQQNFKQQQQLQAFPGQHSSQIPSTVQTTQIKNNFQNNQQIVNQQLRDQLPHIHVEQSPIIDQSQLPQRINPQVEAYNHPTNNQNTKLQNQYKFEDKIYSDSNYGQRLREKSNYNTDKRLEQTKAGKQPFYVSQDQGNFNQGGSRHRSSYENIQAKNEETNSDPEIIQSIAPIEDIQVQPTSNLNEPVNPTVSTQNYNYNQPTESIYRVRNYQQNIVKSQQNGPQPTAATHPNVRYNVRNGEDNRKQSNNEGQQIDSRYNLRNSQYSTAEPSLNRQQGDAERQSEKANKYLTVYSRPHNSQSRRPTTAAPVRNENRIAPSTQAPTPEPQKVEDQASEETPGMSDSEEEEERKKANIAALPDEVPEDLREQLLSSGILGNADIQILDYDKVGDIPIESLPPEALENFYGAASDPVPSVVKPDAVPEKTVEMRVVRYDPNTDEGISNKYFHENATKIDPVFLNDSKYKRYLPLKVSGAQFPIPDVPQLKDRIVNSVVVLAPVDYDFIKSQDDTEDSRKGRVIQIQGVKFVVGDSLMTVIKDPSQENYKKWLKNELAVPSEKQSVVLLVTRGAGEDGAKEEIYMYEIEKESVRKLRGELSSTFVQLASSNSASEDLDRIGGEQDSTTTPPSTQP